MNAVAIFVGLLFWGWVWNVWGMLLAVPLLMVMKAVCDHVEDFSGIGERPAEYERPTTFDPRRSLCFSDSPCRHAALLLDVGRLQRIEQRPAHPLGPLQQH